MSNELFEMFEQLKTFDIEENGQVIKVRFNDPSVEELRMAEAYSLSVIHNKKDGETDPITGEMYYRPTRDNMMEYAKEKGLWSDKDDLDMKTLEQQIITKSKELIKGNMKLSRGYSLAMEIKDHRVEIKPFHDRQYSIYRFTAEYCGEEALKRYLVAATAVYADSGKKVFKNMDDLLSPNNKKSKQILEHYDIIIQLQNQSMSPIEVEMVFLRDYGFLTNDGDLLSVDKKTILYNLYKKENEIVEEEGFFGFYEEDGSVAKTVFEDDVEQSGPEVVINEVEVETNEETVEDIESLPEVIVDEAIPVEESLKQEVIEQTEPKIIEPVSSTED